MAKYRVQLIDTYTEEILEDYVDDEIFDDEDAAQEYASYCNSCQSLGADILKMSNPGEYEEDYGDCSSREYIIEEID